MATLVSVNEVEGGSLGFIGPRKPLNWDIPEPGQTDGDDEDDSGMVPRAYSTTEERHESTGFRYQRCGGGVRVIRKKTGGD